MNLQPLLKQIEAYIEGCVLHPSIQMQHLSGAGATHLLEEKLCSYFSKKYAITFCNATTALLALSASMEIKECEVLSTPFTWGGSISPFLFCGNAVIFGAVENDTLNLDPNKLLTVLSNKTKVILSSDFNGMPANSEIIKNFCSEHGLFYISDSAQSLGSYRGDKPAGYFADATVISFSPGKTFFGGEGGAIITDDPELHEKLIWYSQHPARQKKYFGLSGYNEYAPLNGRLNPLSAILLTQLFEAYEKKIIEHQTKYYNVVSQLQKQDLIILPEQLIKFNCSTYFNLTLRLSEKVKIKDVKSYLIDNGFSFQVDAIEPNCIPFDKIFKKQFAKRFLTSALLNEQHKWIRTCKWIKLNLNSKVC